MLSHPETRSPSIRRRTAPPYETLRLQVFAHALEDMRALQLCESLCGPDDVRHCILECAGMPGHLHLLSARDFLYS